MELFALTFEAVRAWCERKNILVRFNEQLQQLAIPRPDDPNHHLRVLFRRERGMVTLAMPFRFPVPEGRAAAVDEALSYLNSASFMGCYAQNHAGKEIYFRVTVPSQGVGYTDASVEWLMRLVIGSHDHAEARLRAVAEAGAEPRSVLGQPAPDA
jgi:hypothetical protein